MLEISENEKALWQGVPALGRKLIVECEIPPYQFSNENIIAESLDFRENLCQQREFRFGLVEGNSITFRTYGIDNLSGTHINVFIEASDGETTSRIGLGRFMVQSHKRTARTAERSLTAYSEECYVELHKQTMEYFEAMIPKAYVNSKIVPGDIVLASMSKNTRFDYAIYETLPEAYAVSNIRIGTIASCWEGVTYGSKLELRVYANGVRYDVPANMPNLIYAEQIDKTSIDEEYLRTEYEEWLNYFKQMVEERLPRRDPIKPVQPNPDDLIRRTRYATYSFPGQSSRTAYDNYINLQYYGGSDINLTVPTEYELRLVWTQYESHGGQIIPYTYTLATSGYTKICDDVEFSKVITNNAVVNIGVADLGTYAKKIVPKLLKDQQTFKKICEDYLELYALFGMYDRNGVFKTYSVDGYFGLVTNQAKVGMGRTVGTGKNSYTITNATAHDGAYYEDYKVEKIGTVYFDYRTAQGADQLGKYVFDGTLPNKYYIQDNYFLNNITWSDTTANPAVKQISALLDKEFVANTRNITWTPMQVQTRGLPFIEVGDVIKMDVGDEVITTFVQSRRLTGIQMLTDEFTSDEAQINTYNFEESEVE